MTGRKGFGPMASARCNGGGHLCHIIISKSLHSKEKQDLKKSIIYSFFKVQFCDGMIFFIPSHIL